MRKLLYIYFHLYMYIYFSFWNRFFFQKRSLSWRVGPPASDGVLVGYKIPGCLSVEDDRM